MNKLSEKKWKKFRIVEIFNVKNTASILAKDIEPNSGSLPYVTASSVNNGVSDYISFDSNYVDEGNSIFIGGKTLTINWQEKDYVSNDSHNLSLVIKNEKGRTKYAQLFMVTALRKSLKNIYQWSDSISKKSIQKDFVYLPVNEDEKPDFDFMDSYMKQVENSVSQQIDDLYIKQVQNKINILKWREFHLYDIFDIDSGTKFDRIKMTTFAPEIDFVGRANVNQGVTAKVDRINGITPYKAGNLTLALGGAYLGSCFIQKNDFYTSQNVIVLSSKENISFETKIFISSIIFKESQLHYKAFIDELNPHIKKDFVIKLPVNKDGNPDYSFMEDYIKQIKLKNEAKIEILQG